MSVSASVSIPSFHVLIATVGRPSLKNMLASLRSQLSSIDKLTIVFDGKQSVPEKFRSDLAPQSWTCEVETFCEPVALGFWGHGIRTKYTRLLSQTTFIMHADDDDVYVPDAFDRLRNFCTDTQCLYVARMLELSRGKSRVQPSMDASRVRERQIGTPCGIIPYALAHAVNSTWPQRHGGDGVYYESLAAKAKRLVFLKTIIYIVKPTPRFLQFLQLGEWNVNWDTSFALKAADTLYDEQNGLGLRRLFHRTRGLHALRIPSTAYRMSLFLSVVLIPLLAYAVYRAFKRQRQCPCPQGR